uniref:Uncharacterized protein n=1 Tax=Lotharella oceanica TaxID=641309 RepID=A0A7S2TW79_9EUKA|mmetsp:Transcript_32736/g.60870  ORF Transcript_32736/g.60870 Transcript_32736/m.60870 type:complete len:300 (+) Transcript_32736:387-1286(+)
MVAFKAQQNRWTKGYSQIARKLFWKVLCSKKVSVAFKIEAVYQLIIQLGIHVLLFSICVLSPWLTYFDVFGRHVDFTYWFPLAWVFLCVYYMASLLVLPDKPKTVAWFVRSTFSVLVLCFLSIGLSAHNAIAYFEGFLVHDNVFVRTPKEGEEDKIADGYHSQAAQRSSCEEKPSVVTTPETKQATDAGIGATCAVDGNINAWQTYVPKVSWTTIIEVFMTCYLTTFGFILTAHELSASSPDAGNLFDTMRASNASDYRHLLLLNLFSAAFLWVAIPSVIQKITTAMLASARVAAGWGE